MKKTGTSVAMGLIKILVLTWVFLIPGYAVAAAGNWEVAAIFLSTDKDGEFFQQDVDKNILELAKLVPGKKLKLSIWREWTNKVTLFFPNPESSNLNNWNPLFETPPLDGIQVPGKMTSFELAKSNLFFGDEGFRKRFFKKAYSQKDSKKLLFVFTHGLGPRGFQLADIQTIKNAFPKVDLLWMDSCLMINAEAVWELRDVSPIIAGSQDTEFTYGSPLDALELLQEKTLSPQELAIHLADQYVNSYSYLQEGSQRNAVFSSAATVSVIEPAKLATLFKPLKAFYQQLKKSKKKTRETLLRAARRFGMEGNQLIDLGSFVKTSKDKSARLISQILEVSTLKYRRTNPRIALIPPQPEQMVVWGYEYFQKGDREDIETIERTPLKIEGYLPGPQGKLWPSRVVNKKLWVSPFFPGAQVFNFFFVDPQNQKRSTNAYNFKRLSDLSTRVRESDQNPIVFSAYTQGIGSTAEKYTGLSIQNPFNGIPDLKYMNLDFFKSTQWAN